MHIINYQRTAQHRSITEFDWLDVEKVVHNHAKSFLAFTHRGSLDQAGVGSVLMLASQHTLKKAQQASSICVEVTGRRDRLNIPLFVIGGPH